jgi:hypothetical protein
MLMNIRSILGLVIGITLLTATVSTLLSSQQLADARLPGFSAGKLPASSVTSGDNVYIVWASNKTGTPDVMFRASTDGGQTFNDKVNLSNSSDVDSTDAAISAEGGSITVSWWETNETSQEPLVRTSEDFGATFGPIMNLATNGTIGEGTEGTEEEGE